MRMASSTLLGIVLTAAVFSAGVVTDRLTNVYITNLPLDEQGNLRVKLSEKPSEIYVDSVELRLLDWTARAYSSSSGSGSIDNGIFVTQGVSAVLPFAFSPKHRFLNATALHISIVASAYDGTWRLNLTLNGENAMWTDSVLFVTNTYPQMMTAHSQDLSFLSAIAPGLNTLRISEPMRQDSYGNWVYSAMLVYAVTVVIEYEYLA